MDEKSFLEKYAKAPKEFGELSFRRRYAEPPKHWGERKAQSDTEKSEMQTEQAKTQLHDVNMLHQKKLSPAEFNKMKYRFLQTNEALNKQLTDNIPDLPRNKKGEVDLDKCTTEQKQEIATTIKTFINKNPEYKQMLEGILQRKVSDNEIKREAEGVSVSFPGAQWKYKKSSER